MKTFLMLCGAAAILSLMPQAAQAACDNAGAFLTAAYPRAVAAEGGLNLRGGDYARRIDPGAVVCKAWPANPALTLVAVPLVEARPQDPDIVRGDIEIIVADTASGRPVARLVEKGMADSDAVRLSDLSLDTARYDIRNGMRAFGLRLAMEGSSRVDPFSETSLWLYGVEGNRITRVLDGLLVEHENGENDGNCAGSLTTVERSVSLGQEGAAGYRDLLVDQTETREITKKAANDCKSGTTTHRLDRVVLHFDGKRYAAPGAGNAKPAMADNQLFTGIVKAASSVSEPVAAGPNPYADGPSFDCTKAGSPAEKAICADRRLAKADIDIASIYRKLQAAFMSTDGTLLARDEKYFVAARDNTADFGGRNLAGTMFEMMANRLKFLRGVQFPPSDGVVGRWGNVTGGVVITATAGSYHLGFDTSEPGLARWVCSGAGDGQLVGGVLVIKSSDASTIRVSREGQTIKVQAVAPPGVTDWMPDYCGRNGSIDGHYFSVLASR